MRFVMLGVGSEYSLQEFAQICRTFNHDVVEINMYDSEWRNTINQFAEIGAYILISSSHPYMDSWVHKKDFGYKADIVSISEFIGTWPPIVSFYCPHDLVEPIKEFEIQALSMFNGAFMPDNTWGHLSKYTTILNFGWIKNINLEKKFDDCELTFLPSEMPYYSRQGIDYFINVFEPILALKPRVKFLNFETVDLFQDRLSKFGCEIINSRESSNDLIISTNLVVTNSISSVAVEASKHGVSVFCIADGAFDKSIQEKQFSCYPSVLIVNPEHFNTAYLKFKSEKRSIKKPSTPFNHVEALKYIYTECQNLNFI